MADVVIVDFIRSSFTPARRGGLAGIEDVILGCAFPEAEQGLNMARLVGLLAGLPRSLGASGARITGKAAALLGRESKQFALATQCIGGGQGIATVLEAC